MQHKGQFYLMAAIVIIGLIVGFATIRNYASTRTEQSNVVDLSTELALEGARVIDFGVYSGENIQDKMEDFAKKYSLYIDISTGKSLLFITGNVEDGLKAFSINSVNTGSVTAGESGIDFESIELTNVQLEIVGDSVKVRFGDDEYSFDLTEGENFYFLISQQIGDDGVVTSG